MAHTHTLWSHALYRLHQLYTLVLRFSSSLRACCEDLCIFLFLLEGPHFKMLFCAPSLVAYLLVADRLLDDADLDENGPLRDQGARWKL